jgi:hypothetical protein
VPASCMITYSDTAATVCAVTPAAFSSYAMKAWEMCLNCSSGPLGCARAPSARRMTKAPTC